jgi:N-acetylglucosamine kinase-like BadF-type ATPase
MDLKDATLMILAESAGYPEVARLAQSAYDALAEGDEVAHWVLSEMIGELAARAC